VAAAIVGLAPRPRRAVHVGSQNALTLPCALAPETARSSIARPSFRLVAKATAAGTPAAARRPASPAQPSGRYSARSVSAWPCRLA
jgi:hypothetical protein